MAYVKHTWETDELITDDLLNHMEQGIYDNSLEADKVDGIESDVEELHEATLNLYPTGSASGAVANFPDGANEVPVKSLKVSIEPVQSGSGDPSPTNVRPISGWTEAKVTRCGKNVLKPIIYQASQSVVDLGQNDNTSFGTYLKAGTYTISYKTTGSTVSIYRRGANESANTGLGTNTKATFTTNADDYHRFWLYYSGGISAADISEVQIEIGSSDTTYEPYQANTYTIDLDGTRYGGTLDVLSGVLTVDRGYIASYSGETLPSTWISDRDAYVEGTTPTTGAQVVYELATPLTVNLTPEEVKTLLGTNNIWADTGNTDVTYRADPTLYINKKLASII